LHQKVDCVGKIPTARFGHTIVLVNPVKVVLFGGAVGDTKNFQFTNDTYALNLMTKIWVKLESKIKIENKK
jgi:protein phosphatase